MLLLVLVNQEEFSIYLARLPAMQEALKRKQRLKTLNRNRLGSRRISDVLFAFDEAKRMLVVCSSVKVTRRVIARRLWLLICNS